MIVCREKKKERGILLFFLKSRGPKSRCDFSPVVNFIFYTKKKNTLWTQDELGYI